MWPLCDKCILRKYVEREPHSWLARLWRWHTGWCPGWRAYQKRLANLEKTQAG